MFKFIPSPRNFIINIDRIIGIKPSIIDDIHKIDEHAGFTTITPVEYWAINNILVSENVYSPSFWSVINHDNYYSIKPSNWDKFETVINSINLLEIMSDTSIIQLMLGIANNDENKSCKIETDLACNLFKKYVDEDLDFNIDETIILDYVPLALIDNGGNVVGELKSLFKANWVSPYKNFKVIHYDYLNRN